MINLIADIIFLLITSYICFKAIGYGIYEIKENNNKIGGICVSIFAVVSTVFANVMLKLY